jgi:DNA helicase HerA-like ATPase
LIILHDSPSIDLAHISAMADINEGFSLFDYVRITQADGKAWIGQIVQPNQNISIVGGRLDPTILHGLQLMNDHPDVKSVESVQVFDILILGQFESQQIQTPRLRPLPGSTVAKLDAEAINHLIELPEIQERADGSYNCIGMLLNADDVPLCITPEKFNYHILTVGGTGAGKSNVDANLIMQALRYGRCVLVHDAKPDYGLVDQPNTDRRVEAIWPIFEKYKLAPQRAINVVRIGFKGKCDPQHVDKVVGFMASDFGPSMLASLFFTGNTPADQNAFEGFASSAYALKLKQKEGGQYTVEDILKEVDRRSTASKPEPDPKEAIHEATVKSIMRKVQARKRNLPWLDTVGQAIPNKTKDRFTSSFDRPQVQKVERFDLKEFVEKGRLIIIDYGHMDDDEAYALLLSYFLRVGQSYRKRREPVGIVQVVDEAHRVFDNESRHSATLERAFERVMREGRSVDHSIILSLQNASQIPHRVMNNLNSKIVMRQNSKEEADAATQTMGKDFAVQSMRLGPGHALVSMYESRAVVLVQMAPSPYELQRTDNTGKVNTALPQSEMEDGLDFE